MKEHVLCLDGHVSLFALTVQGHVHVIKYPGWFNPDWEHIMRRKWSHDSTQLLVYWRDDDHQRMHIACLSKDALAEREVRSGFLESMAWPWQILAGCITSMHSVCIRSWLGNTTATHLYSLNASDALPS